MNARYVACSGIIYFISAKNAVFPLRRAEEMNLSFAESDRSFDMNKRWVFLVCASVILSGLAFSPSPSFAQKKTVKACTEEWRANKAANEAAKITEKAYIAKCRAEADKAAAATTTTAPAAPAAPAPKMAPATAKRPADGRQAEYARERACGADWKADKAAGKVPAGMTWPKYWSECNKRKKAAGM